MATHSSDRDRHERFRAPAVVVLVLALVVFAALADELAEWQPFVSLDHHVDEELNERATPWVTSAMEAVSWLGSTPGLLLVTLAGSGVLLARRRVRAGALVAASFLGSEALDALLKVEFARPRPSLAHPLMPQAVGYSFPSGHATGSMAVYGALAYLFVTTARQKRATRVLAALGVLALVLLIGFSRIYLGEHFPSDVIGGWCVALAWLAILVLTLFGNAGRGEATDRLAQG
jgi:undecaprenyl-diphosphatase